MLLDIRPLISVADVNTYQISDALEIYASDSQDLYFQLIDNTLDKASQGFNPPGRRYMPPADSVLTVKLVNIDDDKVINRIASQPFDQDPSIFKISILASDPLDGTVTINLTLVETDRTLHAAFAPGMVLRVK